MVNSGSNGNEVCVISSTIPSVKWFLGCGFANSSKTAFSIAGVNSFEDSP